MLSRRPCVQSSCTVGPVAVNFYADMVANSLSMMVHTHTSVHHINNRPAVQV